MVQTRSGRKTNPWPSTPKRFLDLPPELRNRIYEFAVTETDRTTLHRFKLPDIAQTCRQTRHEARPIAFAKAKITVHIRLKPMPYDPLRALEGPDDPLHQRYTNDCLIMEFIQVFGDDGCFRDITWSIHDPMANLTLQAVLSHRRWSGLTPQNDPEPFLWLTKVFSANTISDYRDELVVAEEEIIRDSTRFKFSGGEAVERGVEEMKANLKGIAGREGFKGFKTKDLKEIQEEVVKSFV